MGTTWTEISLKLPPTHQDAVIDFLIGLGSRGVVLEGQRRPSQRVIFYFRSDEQVDEKLSPCPPTSGSSASLAGAGSPPDPFPTKIGSAFGSGIPYPFSQSEKGS